MRVGGLLPNCAAGKALCGADPRIPQGCPKTCGVCVDGETEVLEDLRCKPKQVQENLQAFILACDGVSTCDGACKEAFDAKYLGCVRGYVPVILEGGFRNEELRRILDVCAPNDRRIPLPLNLYLVTTGAEMNSPMAQAAVEFAIDVVRQDPLLFKG